MIAAKVELENKWWSWKGPLEVADTVRRQDHGMSSHSNSRSWASNPRSVEYSWRTLSTALSICCRLVYFEALKASNLVTSGTMNATIPSATALLYPDSTSLISVSRLLFCIRPLSISSSVVLISFRFVCFINTTVWRFMTVSWYLIVRQMRLYWMWIPAELCSLYAIVYSLFRRSCN